MEPGGTFVEINATEDGGLTEEANAAAYAAEVAAFTKFSGLFSKVRGGGGGIEPISILLLLLLLAIPLKL